MNIRTVLQQIIVWSLCVCLAAAAFGRMPSSSAYAGDVINKWLEDARTFDGSIRELESILRLDLSAEQGMQQAFEILTRNEQGLTLAVAKAQSGGLQAAAFKRAVEEEARRKGANEFADEIRKNNGIVSSLPGAEEAARSMIAATEPANRVLKRVAESFERASQSEKIGAASSSGLDGRRLVKVSHTRPAEEAVTPVYNICQSVPGICPLLVNLALAFLALRLSTITSERVRTCVGSAYRGWVVCENNARNLPLARYVVARANCRRDLVERVGRCIFFAS